MQSTTAHYANTIGVALSAVLAAAVLRVFFDTFLGQSFLYTPFYPAVVVATMYGGRVGGLMATLFAGAAISLWVHPVGTVAIAELPDLIGLMMFVIVSVLMVLLCEAMISARRLAELNAAERQRAADREHAARLEAERANRAKDVLLASVSHELRSPLQSILYATHLLGQAGLDATQYAAALAMIQENVQAQSALIEDLLDMGRITAGKMRLNPRMIDPAQVLDTVICNLSMAAASKRITIDLDYGNEAVTISADQERLQQIICNLLSNAIKFSPCDSHVRVTMRRNRHYVEIEIADDGIGIAPDQLARVFVAFHQASETRQSRDGGLGLGLSIVKHLVELHGGWIRAHSDGLGHGTRMTVCLPAATAEACHWALPSLEDGLLSPTERSP